MLGQYDSPPFRPPNEARSALIRITRGCPWNKCEFCAMYKQVKFEIKPLEEVKSDALKSRQIYPAASSIFLGDSDNSAIEFIESTALEVRDSNQLYEEGFLTAL